MLDILPPPLKSLAVRTKVRYVSLPILTMRDTADRQAPHPYVWMSNAHALSTGLGIENEGLELGLEELPEWEEGKVKLYPAVRRLYSSLA